jgi:hypothetical protein
MDSLSISATANGLNYLPASLADREGLPVTPLIGAEVAP